MRDVMHPFQLPLFPFASFAPLRETFFAPPFAEIAHA
jgi:hypothetical protein